MGRGIIALGLSLKASSGAGVFLPTDIAGCVFWLDASQESYNDNDPVTTMHDWVGGYDLLADGEPAHPPTFKTSIISGQPVVRFDGADDQLTTLEGNIFGGFHNQTWFVVYIIRTHSAIDPIFSTMILGYDDVDIECISFRHSTTPDVIVNRMISKSDELEVIIAGPGENNGALAIIDQNSGTGNMWVNGVNGNDTYEDQTNLDPVYARAGERSQGYWGNYDLAEVLIYNTSLSSGNRALVENYLKAKYGLTY